MQATRGTPLTQPSPQRADRRAVLAVWLTAVAVLTADVVSKIEVVAHLRPDQPADVIGSFLRLDLTRNAGAAFSVGTGATVIFTVVAVFVVAVIVRTAHRLASRAWGVCFGLLLGGALGNLSDRLFRAPGAFRGHVVDWLQLPHWPVFNIADSAISVGAVLAIVLAACGVALSRPTVRP
jgi:signal peptidase II